MDVLICIIKEQVELSCIVVSNEPSCSNCSILSFLFGTQYLDQRRHEWWQCDLQSCHKEEEFVCHMFIDSQVN